MKTCKKKPRYNELGIYLCLNLLMFEFDEVCTYGATKATKIKSEADVDASRSKKIIRKCKAFFLF
jgi:hypothetical protein